MDQLVAFIYEMDDNGVIISGENITINIYKCGSKKEPMNLCSLFMKFPDEEPYKRFLAMTSFPPSVGKLPPRLLVYYNGIYLEFKSNESDFI